MSDQAEIQHELVEIKKKDEDLESLERWFDLAETKTWMDQIDLVKRSRPADLEEPDCSKPLKRRYTKKYSKVDKPNNVTYNKYPFTNVATTMVDIPIIKRIYLILKNLLMLYMKTLVRLFKLERTLKKSLILVNLSDLSQ
jgi:hypothetical protein